MGYAVRDSVKLRFGQPIDGTKTRRRQTTPRRRQTASYEIKVDPRVWAAAKAARRPGERLVIVSAECVRLVPDQQSDSNGR